VDDLFPGKSANDDSLKAWLEPVVKPVVEVAAELACPLGDTAANGILAQVVGEEAALDL